MKLLKKAILLLTLICYTSAIADNVIDEVIWVVGDEAILLSEVEEERLRAQYEGQRIEGDPYCVIPEQIAIGVSLNSLTLILRVSELRETPIALFRNRLRYRNFFSTKQSWTP